MFKWGEHPPVNVLLKALMEGLGGNVKEKEITNREIAELSREAGAALPIIRGRPKTPAPVLDLDAMCKRNRERVSKMVVSDAR